MKKRIILFALVIIILVTCLLLPEALPAQPPFDDEPIQTPIDGGLVLLAAAGGAYAIKKLRDRKE